MDRRCGKVIEYLFASAKLSVQPQVPQNNNNRETILESRLLHLHSVSSKEVVQSGNFS
jgi:hypothetical protein